MPWYIDAFDVFWVIWHEKMLRFNCITLIWICFDTLILRGNCSINIIYSQNQIIQWSSATKVDLLFFFHITTTPWNSHVSRTVKLCDRKTKLLDIKCPVYHCCLVWNPIYQWISFLSQQMFWLVKMWLFQLWFKMFAMIKEENRLGKLI